MLTPGQVTTIMVTVMTKTTQPTQAVMPTTAVTIPMTTLTPCQWGCLV